LAAWRSLGLAEGALPRVVRIKNTLFLEELWVSENILPELAGRDNIEVLEIRHQLAFDASGNLL